MVANTHRVRPRPNDPLREARARRLRTVDLHGVAVHALTETEAVDEVLRALEVGRGGWVITPNLDHLRRARFDAEFRGMLEEADLVVADGMPLIWASRLQGTPLPERVAGSSLVSTLAEEAGRQGRSLFLLGGAPGAADAAGAALERRCPGLRIAGTACPAPGFEQRDGEIDGLREQLRQARPDVVYVALGSPKQERLIREMRSELPGTWWLGVGMSLGFLAGQVRRAPVWMQRAGLEWLHRLGQEPRRLARRYVVDGLPFAARMLGEAGARRCRTLAGRKARSREETRMADTAEQEPR
ncbi:MAG: WecB/TagA/CpsF family glycosyltransferase [Phycisphaeraceae bacterium]